MKELAVSALLALMCTVLAAQQPASPMPDKLVYADFENSTADRVTSSRGGTTTPVGWQANTAMPATFEPVFLEADGASSKRMAFNYKLQAPQQYTGAALQIDGLPQVSGKSQPEDLSGYKELSFDMEADGPHYVRVQLLSLNTSLTVVPGNEAFVQVDVKPGFQNYRIPMKKFATPNNAPPNSAGVKAILKQVTGLQFATNEAGSSGHIIIDNVVFQK
jgi:hypothetical protein